jgi:hypothetical protein
MSVLGVPEEDEPFMLRLTQEFFGAKDEERNRAKVSADPLEIVKAVQQVVDDANEYFRKISDDRRRKPANDLASVIANSQIDGRPIDDLRTDRQTEAHGKQLRRRTEVRADPHQDEALNRRRACRKLSRPGPPRISKVHLHV